MNQESIIVYRNPMEKYFWEHSGTMFLCFIILFASWVSIYWICKKIHNMFFIDKYRYNSDPAWPIWAACIGSFISVISYFWFFG